MSATRMRIEAGRLLVEADETGRLVAVGLRRAPARALLSEVDLGSCRVDAAEVDWTSRRVARDDDEINVQLSATDLELQVRHSFGTGWTTRLVVVNPGAAPKVVESLQLIVRPSAGQRLSALVAGSRLCWAAQASTGDGPLLTARLMSGSVEAVSDQGLELGRLRLAPGQRYVTQLRWELVATPRSVVTGPGRDVLLARTAYDVDEAVLLPDDPDAALVVPEVVGVDAVDEPGAHGRELSVDEPGRHRVELRSADGDVRLDLCWVDSLPRQLDAWATELLAGPRTSAGVAALAGVPAAIVVQAGLGGGRLPDADLAADALDRQTARLLDEDDTDGPADPMTILYLLGEHGRTGDGDVLELALTRESALLAAEGSPPPGLGLAVLRTVLAGLDRRDRLAPLLARAVQRAAELVAQDHHDGGESGGIQASDQAAELELLLAVRPLLPPDDPAHQRLIQLARALGAAVGAGLPGRLVTPPPPAEHAHLVAVLRLLPEDGIEGVTRSWGASPTMLAHRATLEVLDRLTGLEASLVAPAAAWLALGQRHA